MTKLNIHHTLSIKILIPARDCLIGSIISVIVLELDNRANPNSMMEETSSTSLDQYFFYANKCRMNKGGYNKGIYKVVKQ